MADDLVTAAVFGDHTQAVAAQIHLQEAGIPAFLQDYWMSQGLFEFGSATGGVSLQVPASRLDEARRLIDDRLPGHSDPVNWSVVDVGRPEPDEMVENEEAPDEPKVEPALAPTAVEETEPTDLTLREQRANKIVRGAIIGIFVWPVLVLAVWRLVQIANSEERLRTEYQRKANVGTWLVMAGMVLNVIGCCGWVALFLRPL
jgi:hypothetical protein